MRENIKKVNLTEKIKNKLGFPELEFPENTKNKLDRQKDKLDFPKLEFPENTLKYIYYKIHL